MLCSFRKNEGSVVVALAWLLGVLVVGVGIYVATHPSLRSSTVALSSPSPSAVSSSSTSSSASLPTASAPVPSLFHPLPHSETSSLITTSSPAPLSIKPPALPAVPSATKPSKVPITAPVLLPPIKTPTSSLVVPVVPVLTVAVTSTVALPIPKKFPAGALVGIVCDVVEEYVASDPQYAPLKQEGYSRGTGVIIDKRGYILTNRHVGGTYIQKATTTVGYTEMVITITYKNTGCWVGNIPNDTVLPTPEQIELINPTVRVPVLAYKAEPLYEPSGLGWSDGEKEAADFTILKITGLSEDARTFGVNAVPQAFPYAELLSTKEVLKPGVPVLSYGAPADVTEGMNDFFSTIYMLGAVGQVQRVEMGDLAFLNTPLAVRLNMEVSGGRSGSPVLWNGYLVGLIRAHKRGDKTQTTAVASDAILKYLRDVAHWEPGK